MTVQEFFHGCSQLIQIGAVYYAIQLSRCAILSVVVFAFVMLVRKTIWKNSIFLKAGVWSLFLPVFFAGKMRIFDGGGAFGGFLSWPDRLCMTFSWICYLYLGGVFLSGFLMLSRRRKLRTLVRMMERKRVDGTEVYLTEMSVSPFTLGVFCPKIILPKVMALNYSVEEIRLILLHEKMHIRLGHLWFFLFYDILRALLWINPLFHFGAKFFREDMEELCDRVTIRASGDSGYAYGKLLLKSIRMLKEEKRKIALSPHYIESQEYQNVRERVQKIAGYQPYKGTLAVFAAAAFLSILSGMFAGLFKASHRRYTLNESIVIYDMKDERVLVEDGERVRKEVSFDEDYIYVKEEFLQELVRDSGVEMENICIFCGGYYKLPGIGGGGGFGYVTGENRQGGTYVLAYESLEDVFSVILKYM